MKTVVRQLGAIGLITDRTEDMLPPNAWTRLENIRCKREYIEPVDGYLDVTDVGDFPNPGTQDVYLHNVITLASGGVFFHVVPYDSDGDGDANKIYSWDGTTASNITRQIASADVDYTGTASDLWQVCSFNGVAILNNGVDAPQYWDGSGRCSFLPYDGATTWKAADVSETEFDTDGSGGTNSYTAKVIRAFKNYLFALNITEDTTNYPTMVHWSNPADPGSVPDSWDYRTASNDAGRTVLPETDGYVLDAVPLGDMLIIYKEDAIYRCSYVGGQYVFDFDLITRSHGLWATNCAVDIGGAHVCLGDGVVYVHSGGAPRNILEGIAADDLFDSIDSTNYQKTFLAHNKAENEVWICYPESGQSWCNKALIWNYQYKTWYKRDIPLCSNIIPSVVQSGNIDTWATVTGSWSSNTSKWNERTYSPIADTMVAAGKQLTRFGEGKTSDTVLAERTDIVSGDVDSWTMIREIIPHASGDALKVRIGTQYVIDGGVTWGTPQTFNPGVDRKLDVRETAPVHAIQFTGINPGDDWRINAYTVDITEAGNR